MTLFFKENLIKNAFIIVIALFMWPVLSKSLVQIRIEQLNDFLLTMSILLVTVSFPNFAFTYEKSKLRGALGKFLSYSTTGIFMLLTILLLESIVIAVQIVYPFLYTPIFWFSIILYIGIVLYDFWDIMRVTE